MKPWKLLSLVLALGMSTSALAAGATTFVEDVVIIVDQRAGEVYVWLEGAEGDELVVPTNARGILRSGRFETGDLVDVKITQDRGKGRHRGHVTVLK